MSVSSGVLSEKWVKISAVENTGLDKLRHLIEEGVMASTGRRIRKLVIPPYGDQLRFDIQGLLTKHKVEINGYWPISGFFFM